MKKKSLATLVGAGIVTSLSVGVANAAENPFALKELASGYTHLAEAGTGAAAPAKKSDAKCGADVMKSNPEMKCGASMMDMSKSATTPDAKATEKKCAGMKMDGAAPAPAAPPAAAPAEAPKQ